MSTYLTVPRFGRFETAIALPPQTTKPHDVRVRGRFAHAEGEPVAVDAFYDGDDTYRLRFMPCRLGTWRYVVSVGD